MSFGFRLVGSQPSATTWDRNQLGKLISVLSATRQQTLGKNCRLQWLEIVHCKNLDHKSPYQLDINLKIDVPESYTRSETILLAYAMMLTNLIKDSQVWVLNNGFDIDQCRKDIASVFSSTFPEFQNLIMLARWKKFDLLAGYDFY